MSTSKSGANPTKREPVGGRLGEQKNVSNSCSSRTGAKEGGTSIGAVLPEQAARVVRCEGDQKADVATIGASQLESSRSTATHH